MSNDLCQYELDRLKNIQDNQNQLVALGLVESVVPKKQTVSDESERTTRKKMTQNKHNTWNVWNLHVNLHVSSAWNRLLTEMLISTTAIAKSSRSEHHRESEEKKEKKKENGSRKQVKHYTDLDYDESRIKSHDNPKQTLKLFRPELRERG